MNRKAGLLGALLLGSLVFAGASGELTTTTLPETVSFPEWKGEFKNIVDITEGTLILSE